MRILLALTLLVGLSQSLLMQEAEKETEKPKISDDAQKLLDKFDKNNDGEIGANEIPKRAKRFVSRHDKNKDGKIDAKEIEGLATAIAKTSDAAEKLRKKSIESKMADEYEADEDSGLFLAAARDYNKATKGEALYIVKDGKLIFEAYDHGYDKTKEHQLASGTKSFCGVIAAMAVQDGLIQWDENVSKTITEWTDDDRNQITVRMLLSLCAGLPPEVDALQGHQTKNKYEYAVGVKLTHKPGTKFEYGPEQYFAWGEFMRRKLAASEKFKDMNLTDYFNDRIGQHLNIKMTWRTDRSGNPSTPHGIFITANEWAKFGEFVRNKGKIGDKIILKPELLDECFKPSQCNREYGLTWWLGSADFIEADTAGENSTDKNKADNAWMPKDLVFAAGKGKQRLFVSRELGLTIVRLANDTQSFNNEEFLSYLLRGSLEKTNKD